MKPGEKESTDKKDAAAPTVAPDLATIREMVLTLLRIDADVQAEVAAIATSPLREAVVGVLKDDAGVRAAIVDAMPKPPRTEAEMGQHLMDLLEPVVKRMVRPDALRR
jgi:hypothetical protein